MDDPDQPDGPELDDGPQAEDRSTEAAAGAPAGDRDLDELLDDPDASSG